MVMSLYDPRDPRWLEDSKYNLKEKLNEIRRSTEDLKKGFTDYFNIFVLQHGLKDTIIFCQSIPKEGHIESKDGKVRFISDALLTPINLANFDDYTAYDDEGSYIAEREDFILKNCMTHENYFRKNNPFITLDNKS